MVERKHVDLGYKYDFLKNGTKYLQLLSVNWAMEILDTRRAVLVEVWLDVEIWVLLRITFFHSMIYDKH